MIHGEFDIRAAADGYSEDELAALRAKGVEIAADDDELELEVPLNVAFGSPDLVPEIGLDAILAGLGSERQYKNDEQIDNQLRSVLFQIPGPDVDDPSECLDGTSLPSCFTAVLDLGAVDIERGRDHGIPSYNDLRRGYGLEPKDDFVAVTGEASEAFPDDPEVDPGDPDDPSILDFTALFDADGNGIEAGSEEAETDAVTGIRRTPLAARLKALYGDVDRLDAFVGMLAEPHVSGSDLGELQRAIWTRQFEALRDGDRFFYANDPALRRIRRLFGITYRRTLAEIIAMNTDLEPNDIRRNVFLVG
jgi:hypothetical protein